MSKLAIYEGLLTTLATVSVARSDAGAPVMTFQTIRLWRNDLDENKKVDPILYPACLIEFLPSNYNELSAGVQSYDLTVRLHILFNTYKDVDLDILALAQGTYSKVQGKQWGYAGKMKRREETQSFDHESIQDYMQDYYVGRVKDFVSDSRPTTEATITDVIVTPDVKIIE